MKLGRRRRRVVPISRGEIRLALADRPAEELWQALYGWSRQLEPFWLQAIERFADTVDLPSDRRRRHLDAAGTAFDRMDGWWHGRDQLVQARRNEIDSAISFVRNTAERRELRYLIQSPVARHVAGGLRSCLYAGAGGYGRDHLPGVIAGDIYGWAECRTLFPAESATLLQHTMRPEPPAGAGPDSYYDDHHLLYLEPADRFGFRREADAVLAEARRIWERLDRPEEWRLPADLWTREYDGSYFEMHYRSMRDFHR